MGLSANALARMLPPMPSNIMSPEVAREYFNLDPAGREDPEANMAKRYGFMPGGRSGLLNRKGRQGPNGGVGRVAGSYHPNKCWYVSFQRKLYRADHIIEQLQEHGELPSLLPPPPKFPGARQKFATLQDGELAQVRAIMREYKELAEQMRTLAQRKGDAESERGWGYKAHVAHQLVQHTQLTETDEPKLTPPDGWI